MSQASSAQEAASALLSRHDPAAAVPEEQRGLALLKEIEKLLPKEQSQSQEQNEKKDQEQKEQQQKKEQQKEQLKEQKHEQQQKEVHHKEQKKEEQKAQKEQKKQKVVVARVTPLLPKDEIEKRLARAAKYGTTEGVDELKAQLRKHRFSSV